jgi:hypothetical protein
MRQAQQGWEAAAFWETNYEAQFTLDRGPHPIFRTSPAEYLGITHSLLVQPL